LLIPTGQHPDRLAPSIAQTARSIPELAFVDTKLREVATEAAIDARPLVPIGDPRLRLAGEPITRFDRELAAAGYCGQRLVESAG
jgi:hypothetical protein